jgi:hypothetical protein
MTVNETYFDQLTVEQRRQMCDQRILGYEADLFGHLLNQAALDVLPDEDPGKADALAQATTSIDTLTASIDAVRAVLAALPSE